MQQLYEARDLFIEGTAVTVQFTLLSMVFMVIIAFIGGFGRIAPWGVVRAASVCYIEFFRGTSLFVQLFWLFFALPMLGVKLPAAVTAVLGMSLCFGAYGAEVVRAAIVAVPKEQTEAAIALNMTPYERMRMVILPQAVRAMLPPFGNLLIELTKATALISLIAIHDLTFQARMFNLRTVQTIVGFGTALTIYFVFSQILMYGVRRLERRFARGVLQPIRL
jgi:polar amino acid transport system permease protein